MNNLFSIGEIKIKKLCQIILWVGIVKSVIISILSGVVVYLNFHYEKSFKTAFGFKVQEYTNVIVNNFPLAIFVFIIVLFFMLVGSKIFVEILYIILNFLKSNTKEESIVKEEIILEEKVNEEKE